MRVDAAMEKESIENGLQRREECDLGEVEGKRETLSLSLLEKEQKLLRLRRWKEEGRRHRRRRRRPRRRDGYDDEERKWWRSQRREGKEGNLSRVECNGGAGFG